MSLKCPGCGVSIWHQRVSSDRTLEERLYDMQQVKGKNVVHRCASSPERVAGLVTVVETYLDAVRKTRSGIETCSSDEALALWATEDEAEDALLSALAASKRGER